MDPALAIAVSAASGLFGAVLGNISAIRVANLQYRASSISTGRQSWTTKFRETLAELQGAVAMLTLATQHADLDLTEFRALLQSALKSYASIILLIDENEPKHRELATALRTLFPMIGIAPEGRDIQEMDRLNQEVLRLGQEVLKQQWERIKKAS